MAKRLKPRRIVVNDIEYRWSANGNDYDYASVMVSISVETPSPTGHKNALRFAFATSILILPSFIRQLILDAFAAGWRPFEPLPAGFSFTPAAATTDKPLPDVPDPKKPPRRTTEQMEEELLLGIRAAPDEDAPRLVYADWLLERGDLRGEYINLACQPSRTPAEEARMQALFEEHQWTWLGPMGDLTSNRRWSRGLVEDAVLGRRARGVVDRGIGDVGWRSLRRLHTHGPFLATSDIVSIVSHPVLHGLDALATTFEVFECLVELADETDLLGALSVEELTVFLNGKTPGENALALLRRFLNQLPADPRERRLRRLLTSDLGHLRSEFFKLLTDPMLSVVVQASISQLAQWHNELNRASSSIELSSFHIARSFMRMFEPLMFEAIFRRDDTQDGAFTHLTIRFTDVDESWARREICDGIRSLPKDALTVLSAEGPDNVAWDLAGFLRDLRDVATSQSRVSLEGLLRV